MMMAMVHIVLFFMLFLIFFNPEAFFKERTGGAVFYSSELFLITISKCLWFLSAKIV